MIDLVRTEKNEKGLFAGSGDCMRSMLLEWL